MIKLLINNILFIQKSALLLFIFIYVSLNNKLFIYTKYYNNYIYS